MRGSVVHKNMQHDKGYQGSIQDEGKIVKDVKKVCCAIKLFSYYFSYVSNDINLKSTHLIISRQGDVSSNILSWKKYSSKSSTPGKFLGLRSKMGVYERESLSCNGHSDQNIS